MIYTEWNLGAYVGWAYGCENEKWIQKFGAEPSWKTEKNMQMKWRCILEIRYEDGMELALDCCVTSSVETASAATEC
jgi:hypothetical protein